MKTVNDIKKTTSFLNFNVEFIPDIQKPKRNTTLPKFRTQETISCHEFRIDLNPMNPKSAS
jgi:hypothetical protein